MQNLKGNGTPFLYIGRMVLKQENLGARGGAVG